MKYIPLTQGQFAIVDDENYEWLNQWKWNAQKDYNTYYATRRVTTNGKSELIKMHRLILGLKKGDGKITDHRNNNGIDNRVSNIRTCTHTQNVANRRPFSNKTSRYKGVYWFKKSKKWRAKIGLNHKRIQIGMFNDEKEAAKAYDAKAKELFREFAYLNFPACDN